MDPDDDRRESRIGFLSSGEVVLAVGHYIDPVVVTADRARKVVIPPMADQEHVGDRVVRREFPGQAVARSVPSSSGISAPTVELDQVVFDRMYGGIEDWHADSFGRSGLGRGADSHSSALQPGVGVAVHAVEQSERVS